MNYNLYFVIKCRTIFADYSFVMTGISYFVVMCISQVPCRFELLRRERNTVAPDSLDIIHFLLVMKNV
jgi:hypothetical protein